MALLALIDVPLTHYYSFYCLIPVRKISLFWSYHFVKIDDFINNLEYIQIPELN